MLFRSIEVLNDIYDTTILPEDAVFLDSALTYSGSSVTTITGLDHLEGETVGVLANGAAHPDKVVTSGSITLDWAVTKAQVGLNYVSDMQTLSLEGGATAGTSQGLKKNVCSM